MNNFNSRAMPDPQPFKGVKLGEMTLHAAKSEGGRSQLYPQLAEDFTTVVALMGFFFKVSELQARTVILLLTYGGSAAKVWGALSGTDDAALGDLFLNTFQLMQEGRKDA